jgi:hypothetical protein
MTHDESKRTAAAIARSNVSRSKSHERRWADLLSQWTGVQFRRRRIEGRTEDTILINSTGDIIPTRGSIHFNIEAKIGKGFSFDSILKAPQKALFTAWYHQSSYDAKLFTDVHDRKVYPFVFFKPTMNSDWVALSSKAFYDVLQPVKTHADVPRLDFDHFGKCGPIELNVSRTKNKSMVSLELDPVTFVRWPDFRDGIRPESFFTEPSDVCVRGRVVDGEQSLS